MGVDSLRIARLSVEVGSCGFQVTRFLKGTEGSSRVEGGFLGDPVGSFVGSLPCVLLCALTIEWTGKRQKEENCCYVQ